MARDSITQEVRDGVGMGLEPTSGSKVQGQGLYSPGQGPTFPSPHTRQGLHSEGPVPPLATEGSNEATVRLDNTSVQEARESIKGQDVAQLEVKDAE